MNAIRIPLLSAVSAALSLSASLFVSQGRAEEPAEQILFSDGKSRIYLEVPDAAARVFTGRFPADPAEDFSRVFAVMTGQEIGSKAEGKIPLRLELLAAGSPDSPLKELAPGFRETASEISVTPEAITIRGESPAALSGGLYKILEDWGCRWILPGDLGEVIPSHQSLALPSGSQIVQLGCDMGFGAYRKESALWIQRNRQLRVTWLPCFHYWNAGLDPEKNFAKHPEYFALVDGERRPTQPETVNPEVIRLKVEHAKEFFRENPTARTYPMDPEDNTSFSEAPEATKLDPPGTGPDGKPFMTDRVVQFANAVQEGFQEEFPDKMVGFYSYLSHSRLPVNVKPSPQTVVGVTRFGFCNLRLVPTPTTPSPQEFEDLVKGWLGLTPHVFIYEYNPPSWGAMLPFPNYITTAESMQRLHKMGVKGFYSDVTAGEHAPGVFLNAYIRRRMMVDPTQDPKALMKDYCRSFFGPAAEAMEKYYATLEKVTSYNDPKRPVVGVSIYRLEEIYPRDVIAQASAELDAALTVPGISDLERKRLEWVKLGQDYLDTYLSAVDAVKAGNYDEAKKQFALTQRSLAVQDRAGKGFIDLTDARRRILASESTLLAAHFPKEQGMITDWKLLDLIPRRDLTPEEDIAILKAWPLKSVEAGGQTYRWNPYVSESGILDFNTAFQRSGLETTPSKAFAAATVEAPEAMEASALFSSFYPFSIYLNGEKIFVRDGSNFDFPDARTVKVQLRKGSNHFIMFCDERGRSTPENTLNDGFQWSVSLALRNASGAPLNLKETN